MTTESATPISGLRQQDVAASAAADLLGRVGFAGPSADDLAAASDSDRQHMSAAEGWARSGAQRLTALQGRPPGDIAGRLSGAAIALEAITGCRANPIVLDGPALLGERAALSPVAYEPNAGKTLRGAGIMLETSDGWLAANMPRDGDLVMIPALTDGAVPEGDMEALARWTTSRRTTAVLTRAHLLGLAMSEVPPQARALARPVEPWTTSRLTPGVSRMLSGITVLDMSGLWAGPLAASLLGEAGAAVLRVESEARPAPNPPPDEKFEHLLNGQKEHLRIDFTDRESLRRLVEQADVVIVSSRPRAIENLGLRQRAGQVWVRITAYGGQGAAAGRIGFGDDAAASAGAVYWHAGKPNFCGDALADPITGLLAAVAALGLLSAGSSGDINISLAGAARWSLTDDVAPDHCSYPAMEPRARNKVTP